MKSILKLTMLLFITIVMYVLLLPGAFALLHHEQISHGGNVALHSKKAGLHQHHLNKHINLKFRRLHHHNKHL